jgi:hypothetical protein
VGDHLSADCKSLLDSHPPHVNADASTIIRGGEGFVVVVVNDGVNEAILLPDRKAITGCSKIVSNGGITATSQFSSLVS